MWWVMAWLGNGFRCSMKDKRTCTMRREVGVHLWWMMTWCIKSTKECVTTDVSQFLIWPCTFFVFQGLYSMTLSVVIWVTGGRILWGGCTKTCATISASIMAENMWKNSLKNVESDNNKILYETLLDFFYSETLLTVWISLVHIVHFLDKYSKILQNARYMHQDYRIWPKPFCFAGPDMWKIRTEIKWCLSVKYEFCHTDYHATQAAKRHYVETIGRLRLKCVGTCAETRFRLSAKRTSPFKSAVTSVQSTTGSRGVRISGINAGYTMFRGSVKGTGYPPHSPVSPSLPLPWVTVCHHISTGLYRI